MATFNRYLNSLFNSISITFIVTLVRRSRSSSCMRFVFFACARYTFVLSFFTFAELFNKFFFLLKYFTRDLQLLAVSTLCACYRNTPLFKSNFSHQDKLAGWFGKLKPMLKTTTVGLYYQSRAQEFLKYGSQCHTKDVQLI